MYILGTERFKGITIPTFLNSKCYDCYDPTVFDHFAPGFHPISQHNFSPAFSEGTVEIHENGEEVFVIEGSFCDEIGEHRRWSWCRSWLQNGCWSGLVLVEMGGTLMWLFVGFWGGWMMPFGWISHLEEQKLQIDKLNHFDLRKCWWPAATYSESRAERMFALREIKALEITRGPQSLGWNLGELGKDFVTIQTPRCQRVTGRSGEVILDLLRWYRRFDDVSVCFKFKMLSFLQWLQESLWYCQCSTFLA